MKTMNKILGLSMVAVLAVGCNELDTQPMGAIVSPEQKAEVIAVNPDMIEASVSAIPQMLKQFGSILGTDRQNDFGYPALMMFYDHRCYDLVSEDIGFNWFAAEVEYDDYQKTAEITEMTWGTYYNQIYACNAVINTIDPETKDSTLQFFLAQALSFRAFDYMMLAQAYGKTYVGGEDTPCVPIITPENADNAAADGCPRSTVGEVYEMVIADLTKAIECLEATQKARTDKGMVDVATAYGLRARANLIMNKWDAAAADAATAIQKSSAVPASIEQVGIPTFKDSSEANWMWAVEIEEQDRVVTTGICNFPSMMGSLSYGYASPAAGAYRFINQALYAEIPATDVRKGWFLDENSESPNIDRYNAIATVNPAAGVPNLAIYMQYVLGENPFMQVKFAPNEDVIFSDNNANDVPMMRIEEMYLIKAEAEGMTTPATGAKTLTDFVKQYRDPSYNCTAATAQAVQEAVYFQRRVELWGEGFSYFDMLRLKKPMDRRGAGFEASLTFNIPADDPVLLLQIPEGEENGNPQLGENNPMGTKPTPVK